MAAEAATEFGPMFEAATGPMAEAATESGPIAEAATDFGPSLYCTTTNYTPDHY